MTWFLKYLLNDLAFVLKHLPSLHSLTAAYVMSISTFFCWWKVIISPLSHVYLRDVNLHIPLVAQDLPFVPELLTWCQSPHSFIGTSAAPWVEAWVIPRCMIMFKSYHISTKKSSRSFESFTWFYSHDSVLVQCLIGEILPCNNTIIIKDDNVCNLCKKTTFSPFLCFPA